MTTFELTGTQEEIYASLVSSMKERGLYEESLTPSIVMLASLIRTYNNAYDEVCDQVTYTEISREEKERHVINPAFQAMATLSEQIRKYMRDLGLVVAKPAGFVSQSKEPSPNQGDKLSSMIEMVSHPKMSVYKKAKK